MNIKNYTSEVPAMISIARIEDILAKAGASGIAKEFKEGRVVSLAFHARLPNGREISIRLPAQVKPVYEELRKSISRPVRGTEERLLAQAERTAWKLMHDWTAIQLSLIQLQQADFLQVFLPYVHDGKQSFYERIKGGNFLALNA